MSVDDLKLLEELENQADLKAAFKARKEKGSISLERIELRLAASRWPTIRRFYNRVRVREHLSPIPLHPWLSQSPALTNHYFFAP